MFRLIIAVWVLSTSVVAAEPEMSISFESDILPLLTRAGCNSGACHGAAAGRGEFRLSLYGSRPQDDFVAIVHELEGRRINTFAPNESLILNKATETILHGGGPRLEYDGPGHRLLLRWIEQGASPGPPRSLKRFTIHPGEEITVDCGSRVRLRTTAQFETGLERDVTQWTVFQAEDETAFDIETHSMQVTVRRPGRHVIMARYLNQVRPIVVLVPNTATDEFVATQNSSHPIDQHVDRMLNQLRIPASGPADDSTFVRRVTLDLTGRLPTVQSTRAFLESAQPEKRRELIDTLLESKEFEEYWAFVLSQLLQVHSQPNDSTGARQYYEWIRTQVESRRSYRAWVRDLLLAEGDSHVNGPANFYRTNSGPREHAEFVSETFLGSRLRCANCHDHPLDRWTQDDYHGLAAIFATVQTGRYITLQPEATVIHPGNGEPAIPRLPGHRNLHIDQDARMELADWLTSPENALFTRSIVNRLWREMFGRGLVEPVDDFRTTNPATHPELLNWLAEDFATHQYDIRHTLRTIANSAAYQRSTLSDPQSAAGNRFYAHAQVRPLRPEVLADAITDATGVPLQLDQLDQSRGIDLYDARQTSNELDILGRCVDEAGCSRAQATDRGLPFALHLINGALLNRRLSAEGSVLARLFESNVSEMQILEQLYWRLFSRRPSDRERKFWSQELQSASTKQQTHAVLEDALWGMLSSQEFMTNH